ncbi:hypothetical protein TRFO_13165 [Tritrichomonas foetus]|uniref:RRM domain-containing protein n=1 Tax=Tritrichomonas foetus TaxID=1144522 RepID=A0A1J4L3S1_9EUKA|nr:hypothetical protein TRFO_13165 [Tritrichomonas foetus]|eukprot:OHT16565.1 hypothetical protein TRFO_13165 [Tritrichomonas foetus]
MNDMENGNIIYISNIPVDANANSIIELYGKYGKIFRVKFLNQLYSDDSHEEWGTLEYSSGVALLQFQDNNSYRKCIEDKDPLIINGYVLINETDCSNIKSKYNKSAFVFYTSPHINFDFLVRTFSEKYSVDFIEILYHVSYNRPGMAVVRFPSIKQRQEAADEFCNSDFCVELPSYDFEKLSFDEDDIMPPVIHVPDRTAYYNHIQFERWLDFKLKYLDQPTFKVNSFLASQFSSKIRDQLMNIKCIQNPNIFKVSVTTQGDFQLVADSLMGQTIQITPENAIFLLLCAQDLGMEQLESAVHQLIDDFNNEEMIFKFCNELYKAKLDTSRHVEFFAKNFKTIRGLNSFKMLPLDIICLVLDSPYLEIGTEKSYSEWLFEFYDKDDSARIRLIPYMLKYMNTFDGEKVRSILAKPGANMNSLREPISQLLRSGLGEETITIDKFHTCKYDKNSPSDGIFGHIKKVFGKPVSEVVEITGSSCLAAIIDPQTSSNQYYVSPSMEDMWIEFDFKKHPFICHTYTLKTINKQDAPHLKNWALEGSIDGKSWIILHSVEKNDSLRGPGKVRTFDVNNSNNTQYRFLRLHQTGKNWHESYQLLIQTIEFYGSLGKEGLLYSKGKEWFGVFDYLSKKYRTNPVHIGEIKIKCAADPSFLVNPEWSRLNGMWRSPDYPNSFVSFNFHDIKVAIDMYTLKTYQGPNHPQEWVVEGSDDGVLWSEIDRKNQKSFSKPWEEVVFTCRQLSKPFSHLRIKMTGPTKSGQHIFWLSYVEFYGKIFISNTPNQND